MDEVADERLMMDERVVKQGRCEGRDERGEGRDERGERERAESREQCECAE